jgi:hypothetical protein
MRKRQLAVFLGACLMVGPVFLQGQDEAPYPAVVGPLSGTAVLNAPFSATAVLTVKGHLKSVPADDPTRIWDTYTTRLQRDSAGRVRADYDIPDTNPAAPKGARRPVYQVVPDPASGFVYLVDPRHQVIRNIRPSHVFDADVSLEIPLADGPLESAFRFLHLVQLVRREGEIESLGSRRIEGLTAVGRVITNARFQSIDEQWASPELRLTLYSHHRLPHRGTELEYRLKHISLREPPAAVFDLPDGYAKYDREPTLR